MRCPYLEEVVMRYCQAYPVKKMIPASSSQLVSPCFASHEGCPVYQDVRGKKTQPRKQVRTSADLPQAPTEKTETTPVQPEGKEQKHCVWVRQEMVSYRLCTRNYDCASCSFEQMLIERDGKYVEPPQVVAEVERLRKLPADQRRCKYTVTGKILLESCQANYECWQCPKYKELRNSIVEACLAEAKK